MAPALRSGPPDWAGRPAAAVGWSVRLLAWTSEESKVTASRDVSGWTEVSAERSQRIHPIGFVPHSDPRGGASRLMLSGIKHLIMHAGRMLAEEQRHAEREGSKQPDGGLS